MSKSNVDPTVYALAEQLAEDLPPALERQRLFWTQRLAEQLQQAYEDWSDDMARGARIWTELQARIPIALAEPES
jgi:hypothetical protein